MSEIKCANCGRPQSEHGHLGMPDEPICPSFTAPDEPTDADLEKLGNRAMGFLVAKYGYPQVDRFVNWSARPEQIALEMAEFTYRILAGDREGVEFMKEPEVHHVVPQDDTKPHSISLSLPCECQTRNERQPNGNWLVIHNAYDGREFDEPQSEQERKSCH